VVLWRAPRKLIRTERKDGPRTAIREIRAIRVIRAIQAIQAMLAKGLHAAESVVFSLVGLVIPRANRERHLTSGCHVQGSIHQYISHLCVRSHLPLRTHASAAAYVHICPCVRTYLRPNHLLPSTSFLHHPCNRLFVVIPESSLAAFLSELEVPLEPDQILLIVESGSAMVGTPAQKVALRHHACRQ
jgi:hypothetical protein